MPNFDFEVNKNVVDIDLDKKLNNKENRKLNNLGLYRLTCLAFAASGFGKTTTILKALLSGFIDNFVLCIIIIPRESLDSGLYRSIYEKKMKGFVFYVIGEDELPTIEQLNQISAEIKGPMAIIIDDYVNAFGKNEWLLFKRYITQSSRITNGASLFALSQDLYSLKPNYRKGFNTFLIFPASMTQLSFNDMLKNFYQNQTFTNDELKTLYTTLKKDKHGALWLINNNDPEHSMLFNNIWIKKYY